MASEENELVWTKVLDADELLTPQAMNLTPISPHISTNPCFGFSGVHREAP